MRVSTPVNNKHDNGAQTSLSIVAWYGRNYKTAFHNKIQQITKDSETSVKEEVSKLVAEKLEDTQSTLQTELDVFHMELMGANQLCTASNEKLRQQKSLLTQSIAEHEHKMKDFRKDVKGITQDMDDH